MSKSNRAPQGQVIPGLGNDLPELQQARALWQANRFDDALRHFEAAARRYPQNLVALIDGSRALGARFEIQRAEAMLARLLKLGGSRPDILHFAGQSYRMIFRPDEAIACFQKVLSVTREIPDAYLELAVLYERRHRLAEARQLIEDCLRSAPDYQEARFFQARLLRRLKEDRAADEAFRRLATGDGVNPIVQAQAWAELAQAQDRQGDYRGAMDTMLRCKRILQSREAPVWREAEFVLHHLTRLAEALTADHFRRWAEATAALPPRKTAVLTSFPRSGTTLLEQVLDSHSGLVSSDEREAFARDIFPAIWLSPSTPHPTVAALEAASLERLDSLRARYFSYMEAALQQPIGDRIHLDKNPPLTLVLPGFLRLFRRPNPLRAPRPARRGGELLPAIPSAESQQRLLPDPRTDRPPRGHRPGRLAPPAGVDRVFLAGGALRRHRGESGGGNPTMPRVSSVCRGKSRCSTTVTG